MRLRYRFFLRIIVSFRKEKQGEEKMREGGVETEIGTEIVEGQETEIAEVVEIETETGNLQ